MENIYTKSEYLASVSNNDSFTNHLIVNYLEEDLVLFQDMDNFKGFAAFHPNYSCSDFKNKIIFTFNLPQIQHEFAHFVEVDESRFNKPDFGLGGSGFLKQNKSKKAYYAASFREERVCAIQQIIMGQSFSIERTKIKRNSFWAGHFDEYKCAGDVYKDFQEFEDACVEVNRDTFNYWSLDKIEEIFNRRINQLQMELKNSIKQAALFIIITIYKRKSKNDYCYYFRSYCWFYS